MILDISDTYMPDIYKPEYQVNDAGQLETDENGHLIVAGMKLIGQKTFYKSISKIFIKTNVDATNYRVKHYYIYNTNSKEMELDGAGYNPNIEYYSIIDKPKILFPWRIGNIATEAPGNI
jgi:hypothetical protein